MRGDSSLPLCMRYQRSKGATLGRGPLIGGDPSLPLCMKYQGSRGSVHEGTPGPITKGDPYALVCICSGGDPSWEGTPPSLSV